MGLSAEVRQKQLLHRFMCFGTYVNRKTPPSGTYRFAGGFHIMVSNESFMSKTQQKHGLCELVGTVYSAIHVPVKN